MNDLKKHKKNLSEELNKSFKNYKKHAELFAKIYQYFNIKDDLNQNPYIDLNINIEQLLISIENKKIDAVELLENFDKSEIIKLINSLDKTNGNFDSEFDINYFLKNEDETKLLNNLKKIDLKLTKNKEKQMSKRINIAIDGPSGVGKTVMSNMLAKKLGYKFLSSGSFYRVVAYNAIINNINLEDEKAVNEAWNIEDLHVTEDDRIIFKDEDVSTKIREDNVSRGASSIAKFASVREKVNHFIQTFGAKYKGIIVDGRDATYRILPQAEVKFFLWATPEIRALRRVRQDKEMGIISNYEEVLESMKIRDYNDMNRKIDPLKVSEGSIEIDTTDMSIEENFEVMYNEVLKRL
ncbi:(d)CMP kinase [Metamycoplasma spumans]|uniref:(d)CMP kinase n=1 Tax=Metamycoplasma spumans TaxID=92406 RepID=UPI0034DD6325